MARFIAVLLLAFTTITRGQSSTTTPSTKPVRPLRVLFIGNEYTSSNGGIHAVVQGLAASRGAVVECVASTAGGKTLSWHWESGGARRRIGEGKWDYVVLQPSPVESTAEAIKLLDVIGSFNVEARKAGAKLVVLDTPIDLITSKAQRAFAGGLERLHEKPDVRIAPVGAAARFALSRNRRIRLRAENGDAITPAGTYLVACVVYAILFDDMAEGLPSTVKTAPGWTLAIPPADAEVIQTAVDVETTPLPAPTSVPAFTDAEDRVVFVVDATGTMLGLKFKLAQQHLRREMARLKSPQQFNVIYFRGGDTPDDWTVALAYELLPADEATLRKAKEFIDQASVVGKGTNPLPAFHLAFGLRPHVVYFISDGEFNNVVGYDQVIAYVRKLNARRRTRFNVVSVLADDPRGEETLRTLAREHGGTFSKLSDKGIEPATRPSAP